jgi:hypothetical protein
MQTSNNGQVDIAQQYFALIHFPGPSLGVPLHDRARSADAPPELSLLRGIEAQAEAQPAAAPAAWHAARICSRRGRPVLEKKADLGLLVVKVYFRG